MAEEVGSVATDAVAIDTNVFGNLTHPNINKDQHIHNLLKHFVRCKTYLLVDQQNKIVGEYNRHLGKQKFKKIYDRREEGYLIRYFLHPDIRKSIHVNTGDDLWRAILKIVSDHQEVDQTLVYVAFQSGKTLISNDYAHIISQRDQLLSMAKTMCIDGGDIATSQQAHATLRK